MKKTLSLLLCCIAFVGISQEKQIDVAAMTLQLSEVHANISDIDIKIEAINNRLETNPEEEVAPHIEDKLESLEREKVALEKQAYSIQAAIDNPNYKKVLIVISKIKFENSSKEKQEEMLAHPEQYKIEDK